MDHYAVIGNPINHSLSPRIHQLFAQQTHQQIDYQALLVQPDQLGNVLSHFQNNQGKGLNITSPFKQEVCQFLDVLSPRALLAGAVNTILFREDGSALGDNTDGAGLVYDLQRRGFTIKNKNILMLGAGGAAAGVLGALLNEEPKKLVIANRTFHNASELVEKFSYFAGLSACALTEIPSEPFNLILHASSAGLQNKIIQLPTRIINKNVFCYDLSYGKAALPFLNWAKSAGAIHCCDGLGMLVAQAAEAFFLWRQVRPNIQSVLDSISIV